MKILISDYESFQGGFAIHPGGTIFISGRTMWALDPGSVNTPEGITHSPVKVMQILCYQKMVFSMGDDSGTLYAFKSQQGFY